LHITTYSSDSDDSDSYDSIPNIFVKIEDPEKDMLRWQEETRDGKLRESPTVPCAKAALIDLKELIHPHRKKGPGHEDPEINLFIRMRMEGMQSLLSFYTNPQSATYWKGGIWQSDDVLGLRSCSIYWSCPDLISHVLI
jgi:hypothetical protein